MFRDVMIADSDVGSRDRMYEILFSMGHKVICVPNQNEAVLKLQTERPYLLIIAETLNPDGGLKALEKIREFDRQMKVVFLAKDEPDIDIQAKAHRLGVTAVTKKDFSGHLMFKQILEILRQTEGKLEEKKYLSLGTILVVDDTQEMRITLYNFLKMRGFNVREAADGEQALMEIKTENPALVLLDERMPGMDGLVVLKKIRELNPAIQVVMMSGVQDEDVFEEAKKQGACDYLVKPFDFEKLEATILSVFIQQKYKPGKAV